MSYLVPLGDVAIKTALWFEFYYYFGEEINESVNLDATSGLLKGDYVLIATFFAIYIVLAGFVLAFL